MSNRHRFWNRAAIGIMLLALVSSCMAPPPRPVGTQSAPNISRPLVPDAQGGISPYSAGTITDDAAATIAQQRVVRVALLLPLTGRNAELGKALQDAASLSLFDKYARLSLSAQTVRVELLPIDTGDTPEHAANAMNESAKQGAEFVIGPLFADAVAAASPIAQAKNISMLSFSNTLAHASPGVYLFGFSPAEQAERVVNYALANGKQRIAVLVPNSALGETILAAARGVAKKQDRKLAKEAKYSLQGAGMENALNSLVVAGQPPDFDAILIPEGGEALDTILRGLNSRGVKPTNVKFLGTGLWDDADLLRRVNLESAWFASSPPVLTNQFETRFRTVYRYSPPRIASLAYDAVALAVTLATSGRPFDAMTLTSSAGYAGPANGIFRLHSNGATQRGLAVMQVHTGTLKVVSPPPAGF